MVHALLLLQALISSSDSATIAAVRAQAEREPVEAIGDRPGLVRVRDVRLLDVNGDGHPEAFVSIERKFRQTPTILIYSFDAKGPHRLVEALVPGTLVPLSDRFEDPHAYRVAIDLSPAGGGRGNPQAMVETAISEQLSVVDYDDFLHTDLRKGFLSYVDLTGRRVPRASRGTCQAFEFELVESLATGTLGGDPVAKYVVALTGSSITVYQITRIRENGLLDKRVVVLRRPDGIASLVTDSTGIVGVRMRDGTQAPLALP